MGLEVLAPLSPSLLCHCFSTYLEIHYVEIYNKSYVFIRKYIMSYN
jgi:hypothetical protein